MSDPLRIIHGPFGRVVLVRLDHSMVLHAHRDCHIVFKIGGSDIQFGINGREYPVTAQSALMINAWEPHFYQHRETKENTVLLAFYLQPQWLKELDRRFAHSAHPKFFARPVETLTPRLAGARDDVVDAITQPVPPSMREMEALIAAVFCEILTISPPRNLLHLAGQHGEMDFDARIRKLIEQMLSDRIASATSDEMALAAGLSRPQFFRLFKKSTGMSPALFVNMLKMESGLHSLTQRDVKLQDIAFDLGFDTAGNFTRFFVGMQGFAPSKYRKILEVM
jgi:AraC family transcriptional regulator